MARYIIIGGVAGGASTAARLRRLDERAEIILVERGDYISYANCGLPYYAGGAIAERDRLFVMTPEKFKAWLNVDVRTGTDAVSLDTAAKTVTLLERRTGVRRVETYDALVLSPGAEPIRPPIPGIDFEGIYTLRSVPDVDAIKKHIDEKRPERAVVVGGGFIGLEMAENLHERGVFVTVVEAQDQVMNVLDAEMAAMVHQQLKGKNVELYLSDGVSSFERKGSRIVVKLASGAELPADIVILSIGVRPDTKFAKDAGIAVAPNGGILVDERMRTNAPDVYALGDAASFMHPVLKKALGVPLAGPANKQARVVADSIVNGGSGRAWNGAIGTSIAKVFDITAASTGLAEKALRAAGIKAASIVTHGSSHAGYYPGALPLTIKTVFDPESGRLYGAQVVGWDGVDKRVDVLAEAVRRGASVVDLAEFEHAYAPPFSSAKDPVNIAGMAAENAMAGLTRLVPWSEVRGMIDAGAFLLDVRTPEEFALGSLPGAVNIPNDKLRDRLAEVPRDKPVLVFCGVGLRGYLGERILRQNGWTDVGNLSGGYKTWEIASARQSNTGVYRPGMAGLQTGSGAASSSLNETYSEGSGMPEHLARASDVSVRVDACGLQCPGPIMKLKAETDKLPQGGRIILSASDPGFARDVRAWSNMTGNRLVSVEETGGIITAVVEKGAGAKPATGGSLDGATFVVFSDDLDKALASLVLANGAASAGKKPTMFFTFWGLSVIKRKDKPSVAKDFMGRMFSLMLPGHMGKLSLSKMNFGGAGALMMKGRMKAKKVDQLDVMMQQAIKVGVRLVACQMSMDIMGVSREELIDGVEIGGVATYMEAANNSNVNLFI